MAELGSEENKEEQRKHCHWLKVGQVGSTQPCPYKFSLKFHGGVGELLLLPPKAMVCT